MELWILFFIFVAIAPASSVMIRSPPVNITTLTGRDVTFRCDVKEQRSSDFVFWKKVSDSEFVDIISYNSKVMDSSKYSVQGSYSLTVKGVNINDEAWYECQAGTDRARAMLNVQVMMDNMTLSWSKKPPFIEEQLINLTCHVFNSRPAANITWFRGQADLTGLAFTRQTSNEEGFGNTTSILTVLTGPDMGTTPYQCVASLPNSDNTRIEEAHVIEAGSYTAGCHLFHRTNSSFVLLLGIITFISVMYIG